MITQYDILEFVSTTECYKYKSDGKNGLSLLRQYSQVVYHFTCNKDFTCYSFKIGRHPYRTLDEARLIARVLYNRIQEGYDDICEYAYRHFKLKRLKSGVKRKPIKNRKSSKKWLYPKKYDRMGYKKNCEKIRRKGRCTKQITATS